MYQANTAKVVSELRYKMTTPHRPRKMKNMDGPQGRIDKLRKTVTALIKHERLELNYNRADESRQYAERLISEAIRYGDCHTETMDMASYWLLEKQLVHKLFKVLVPRFESSSLSYTKMYRAQKAYPGTTREKSILELRGNPYPDLAVNLLNNRNLLHNVLLDAAKVEYRQKKYAEMAEDMIKADVTETIKIANLAISEQQTNGQAEDKAVKPEAETTKQN